MNTSGTGSPSPMERIRTHIEHEVDTRSVRLAASLLRLTKGRIVRLWRRQVLLLTTRGRKSGKERTVPLQSLDRRVILPLMRLMPCRCGVQEAGP